MLGDYGSNNNDPTLKNCLFGAVTLTKKQILISMGTVVMELDLIGDKVFSFLSGGFGQNILIFWADMSSSAHIDNKKKDILVLGKGPTQRLKHTLTAERMYSINFTVTKRNFD